MPDSITSDGSGRKSTEILSYLNDQPPNTENFQDQEESHLSSQTGTRLPTTRSQSRSHFPDDLADLEKRIEPHSELPPKTTSGTIGKEGLPITHRGLLRHLKDFWSDLKHDFGASEAKDQPWSDLIGELLPFPIPSKRLLFPKEPLLKLGFSRYRKSCYTSFVASIHGAIRRLKHLLILRLSRTIHLRISKVIPELMSQRYRDSDATAESHHWSAHRFFLLIQVYTVKVHPPIWPEPAPVCQHRLLHRDISSMASTRKKYLRLFAR